MPFFVRHRWPIVAVGAGYYVAGILLHEEVSKVSVRIERALTKAVYNDAVSVAVLCLVVLGIAVLARRLRSDEARTGKLVAVAAATTLTAAAYNTLLVMNLESIHFLQYGVISIPVFLLTRRFFDSAVWITLLGALDEAYQYFWLYRGGERQYLDFNDMVLNLLGGGLGLVFLFTLSPVPGSGDVRRRSVPGERILRSRAAWLAAAIVAAGLALSVAGIVGVYSETEAATVMLRRVPPDEEFWTTFAWGKTYHNLLPLEGVGLCGALLLLFPWLDHACAHPGRD